MPNTRRAARCRTCSSLQVQRDDELIDLPLTTRRNLELVQTLRGEDAPTLFSLLDTCMTGMGSRLLKCWLLEPRRDRTQATQRLDAIDLLRDGAWRRCASELKGTSDVERITARIALRQVRPRELVGLRQALDKARQLAAALDGRDRPARPPAQRPAAAARLRRAAGARAAGRARRRWCATAA